MSDRVKTLTDTTYPYAGNDLISTNNNGTPGTRTVVASYDYDAFGNGTTAANDYYNPMRYCGEYFDEETGLIYLRARYYDPSIGRFVSEDQHWNLDNMIYGDSQTAVMAINSDDDTTYYDKNGNVVISEEYPNFLLRKISSIIQYDGTEVQTSSIIKLPDMESVIQSSNLYVYGLNNPIKFVDPTGNFAVVDDAVILVGVTVVITVYVAVNVVTNVIEKKKYEKPPNPNRRKGAENRGPNPNAPGKNEQHGDCENHSQKAKGSNGQKKR